MTIAIRLLVGLTVASTCAAGPLSDSDRQLLLERLTGIKEAAEGRVGARIATALGVFRAAMRTNEAALELYLKCIEKLEFADQNRKPQDFREWRRRNKARLDNPAYQLGLRLQLNWLTLTLEAAGDPDKVAGMGPKAAAALDSICANAAQLAGQQNLLRQPVTSTVFARTYNVSTVETGIWPTSPLPLGAVYERLILPPLRTRQSIEALRAAWTNRIRQEALIIELGGAGNDRPGGRDEGRSPGFERFLTDERPELLWRMEEDLFRAGDQKAAALRMLAHLEFYAAHPSAPGWTDRFINLIAPPAPATTAAEPQTQDP